MVSSKFYKAEFLIKLGCYIQGGQTAPAHGRPKMLVPKRPEIGNWKLNVTKNQGSVPKPKVTFDMLFDKYSKQKAVTSDRPIKKG
jgi:hypothetical protein